MTLPQVTIKVNEGGGSSLREHMTAYEAAEVFGVTFRTVYKWIRSGKLRAVKIGKQWYIPKAAVDALLENGEQATEVGTEQARSGERREGA